MADFASKADVQAWVDETENGVAELRWAISIGTFGEEKRRMAIAWLAEHDLAERNRHEALMRKAAVDSAAAANKAAGAAVVAGLIALASLFIAAWPLMK